MKFKNTFECVSFVILFYYVFVPLSLCASGPPRKTDTSCDEDPGADPPKVLKVFDRSLLFDCVSRADSGALEGLLGYLQAHGKTLTEEEFKGQWDGHL